MDSQEKHIKLEDATNASNALSSHALDRFSQEYGDSQQKGGYAKVLGQTASSGALMGLDIGALCNWPKIGYMNRGALQDVTYAGLGYLLKGTAAATADAGVDLLLQKGLGRDIGGHDVFRPTKIETIGMAAAAVVPLDIKGKLILGSMSWLEGRAENMIFDKK